MTFQGQGAGRASRDARRRFTCHYLGRSRTTTSGNTAGRPAFGGSGPAGLPAAGVFVSAHKGRAAMPSMRQAVTDAGVLTARAPKATINEAVG